MNKYLIFRTDRIGDFLISSILINSIKRNDKNSHIIVISSEKNFEYIKNTNLVDEVILYNTKSILFKFNFFLKNIAKKYKMIAVLDGKKRSIFYTLLNFSKYKILSTNKLFYKKIFRFFLSNILLDNCFENKLSEIKYILKILNFKYEDNDLNILKFTNPKKKQIDDKYIIFHLDEKWIYNNYIKTYVNIEPSLNNLVQFLNELTDKSQKKVVVTTGILSNYLIKDLKNININKSIIILENQNIFDLENIIFFSDLLIACHGAPTHIAGAFNIKNIDIIDLSEKDFFYKWSSHFRNYTCLYRKNFNLISKEILDKI